MIRHIILAALLLVSGLPLFAQPGHNLPLITPAGKGKVNTRIDNIGYWSKMVRLGYVKPSPTRRPPPGDSTTSLIYVPGRGPQNSPDVPVTNRTDVTQSENSVFIDPGSEEVVLNSNNSSNWVLGFAEVPFGADGLYSLDYGAAWNGTTYGVPGNNSGDPSTAIGTNGRWYVGKIRSDGGQGVAYSTNQGGGWTEVMVAPGPTQGFGLLDKNHLWIDNAPGSPYEGHLYNAWTNFIDGDPDTNQVEISRSTDHGLSWSSPLNISSGAGALVLNHGVNLQTGPEGEVYAVWSIYDSWPSDEVAIGFSKSIDGGAIFTPATRIIDNIKGIRMSGTGKFMRVSSFPNMTVDISTGPNRGTIYVVWTNTGYPGINTGSDIDLYLIKSTDEGESWSPPIRVNQDPPGLGKQHYLPWITCDPVTGGLCVVYYDDRNLPPTKAETWVSYSYDGGNSWSDIKVSDFSFTPEPIPGLAYNYFGDYIGIQSRNMKVYPTWTDNHARDGRAMTYVSPFDLGPNPGQPWVVYHANTLTPIPAGAPQGLNFGDSLHLNLSIKNIGDQPASGVTVHLSCSNPCILLTDSTEAYGSMGAGEVKSIDQGFAFKVSDTIPDNLRVRFDLLVTSPDSSWKSHFTLMSHAPGLRVMNMVILDTLVGNRNGWLDPGETARIKIANTNGGDFPAPDVYGLLSVDPEWITLLNDSVFLDTINPPQVRYSFYTLTVKEEAPVGTGIDLYYRLHSGAYEVRKRFYQVIGQVTEDWESGTFTKFDWQQGGTLPWTLSSQNPFQGQYAARSGHIYDSQSSVLSLNYTAAADDSISFYFMTSTEQDYDFLMFSIDNVLQGQWSGERAWSRAAFPVSAGTHLFKWFYLKDLAYFSGQDRVAIDFIAMPPPVLPAVNAGADDTLCGGNPYMLAGTVSDADSLRWTTSGDGRFAHDTLPETTYIPGAGDIALGSVTLKLTGWNHFGKRADPLHLTLAALPAARITALPNDTACAGQSIALQADTAGVVAWLWMPGGATTPETALDTTGHGVGTFRATLQVANASGCTSRDSLYLTFRDCTAIGEEEGTAGLQLYPNPTSGRFTVKVRLQGSGAAFITLTDATGNRLHAATVPFTGRLVHTVDPGELPPGIYTLQVEAGNVRHVKKVVIKQ